jgi:purine-nucleoside phosphorylase
MGPVVDRWGRRDQISFGDLPGLTASGVHGHRGQLSLVRVADQPILVFEGRLHFYEGHSWERVIQPTRLAADLGIRTILHTNASGGIRADMSPGSLMAVTDHIELTYPYWWRHPGPGGLGPGRPTLYSSRLLDVLGEAARAAGIDLFQGVYASLTGPSYETRAEIRALRTWGADAVGMSTAREVQACKDLGLECAAVSCITNRATGLSDTPLTHEEVLSVAAAQSDRLARLLESCVGLAGLSFRAN